MQLLNRFMTPVTHPLMPTKAAPGQLSIVEIHQGRHLLGLLPARSFHLLGSPIAQSMSPALHNAGYKSLGLPHSYDLFEASTVTPELRALIRSPTFGGASVTIPLKQEVLTLMDELTPAAMAIGAVNTIIPMRADTDDSIIKLIGDNTDYIGIKRCLEKAVAGATPKAVLVIGAGGTARAACYAAKELGATLAVWNRTTAKAQELATQFGGTAISAEALDPAAFDAIIGTVPGTTQTDLPFFANSQHTLFGIPSVRPRVYVELAYTPRLTPMMQKAGSCGWKTVVGVDVLVEQGLEQFERWTGRHPPLPAAL